MWSDESTGTSISVRSIYRKRKHNKNDLQDTKIVFSDQKYTHYFSSPPDVKKDVLNLRSRHHDKNVRYGSGRFTSRGGM